MGDKNRELHSKYHVERLDKSDRHKDCCYFVLDTTHDPYAVPAIKAYADSCKHEYPLLAKDLYGLLEVLSTNECETGVKDE